MARLLLLGGTAEARALARRLTQAKAEFTVALAGRTAATYPATTRVGGFGGRAGLAAHIAAERLSVVVDATHPFAAVISPNARAAAEDAGVSYLRLERPAWKPAPGERWVSVADLASAAQAIRPAERVLLAVGAGGVGPFRDHRAARFVLRSIEPPTDPLPRHIALVRQRGPFSLAGERTFWRRHNFTVLVAKNAGGRGASAKLIVARDHGATVVMVRRPTGQPRPDAATAEEMMDRLAPHL